MLNRWVLSRDRKTATEGAEVTRSGRLFQTRAVATGKARSPTVRSRVRLTINDEDELERSRWQASTYATWQSSSVRYAGADPCRHLYTRTDCLNAIPLEPSASAADEGAEWCAGTSTRKRWAERRRSSLTAAVTKDVTKRRRVSNYCRSPAARGRETTPATEEQISTLTDGWCSWCSTE